MALFRAYKKSPKNKVLAETTTAETADTCPCHPDLLLLRDAAADERNAIAFYLEAARGSCLCQLFLDIAADEMQHFAELMQMVSCLDPVQAEIFSETGLDALVAERPLYRPKNKNKKVDDPQGILPDRKDMVTVNFLTRAVVDELQAINKYQRYMQAAEKPSVARLFCHIMNEEKEHLAQFTAELFKLTNEPLPSEHV
ncbi:ferritin-like domain-containing protein [Sporomusa sphaeroides]|uniref:ferritin-like domain-containing protein n=1 Tax=Sporomusa sphaeroides TaxID=47679 RepID=UPI002B59C4B0|nr:ferritin-like domain-containing protein [Sporomusa sphaeroides]HML32685.1 ferritin-like domain-containing protein [Sporomusa sphaeroides]